MIHRHTGHSCHDSQAEGASFQVLQDKEKALTLTNQKGNCFILFVFFFQYFWALSHPLSFIPLASLLESLCLKQGNSQYPGLELLKVETVHFLSFFFIF